jgi:hypothetical protein
MWLSTLAVGVALFIGLLAGNFSTELINEQVETEAIAVAANMQIYRNAVLDYTRANPTTTGAVADGALTLPSWYQRLPGIENYVDSGKAYIYYTGKSDALSYKLVELTNRSIFTGVKRGGNLVNPLSTTNITIPVALPTAIPEGSVVIGS